LHREEFYDFIGYIVLAWGLSGAERVDFTIEGVTGDHFGEGDGGVAASGCDYERVGDIWVLPWWERVVERCDAVNFLVEVGVDDGNDGVGGVYGGQVGPGDFVIERRGSVIREEAAFYIEEAVV
jgi:hypothetical protein